jgi:proton-coupled amino acid transporter
MRSSLRHPSLDDEEVDDTAIDARNGISFSVFSYICASVGAGVLSLPRALQYVGWTGLLLMAIVAIACNYTANLLVGCMFAVPGRPLLSYEDIGEQALGVRGRRMVACFQVLTLFGVCTIFLILIGGNMNKLVPALTEHDWIFIFALVLIPVAWLKTMSEVSYLAVFGVLASMYVAGIVVIKGFMRAADDRMDKNECATFDASGLASAINIIVFSFGGHSVLPNIITHLRRPQENYKKVTFGSYFSIGVIYMLTAAGGYAGWVRAAGRRRMRRDQQ